VHLENPINELKKEILNINEKILNSPDREHKKYTFEDDLWDSLNSISSNFRKGN